MHQARKSPVVWPATRSGCCRLLSSSVRSSIMVAQRVCSLPACHCTGLGTGLSNRIGGVQGDSAGVKPTSRHRQSLEPGCRRLLGTVRFRMTVFGRSARGLRAMRTRLQAVATKQPDGSVCATPRQRVRCQPPAVFIQPKTSSTRLRMRRLTAWPAGRVVRSSRAECSFFFRATCGGARRVRMSRTQSLQFDHEMLAIDHEGLAASCKDVVADREDLIFNLVATPHAPDILHSGCGNSWSGLGHFCPTQFSS